MNGSKGHLVLVAAEPGLQAYRVVGGNIGPVLEGDDLYVKPLLEAAAGDVVVHSHQGAGLGIGRLLKLAGGTLAAEDLDGGPTILLGDPPALVRAPGPLVEYFEDPTRRVPGVRILGPVTKVCRDAALVAPFADA